MLTPARRIGLGYGFGVEQFDYAELRQVRLMIKEQSKVAHATGDVDENCLLKHLKNRYLKLELKKKKEFEMKIMKNTRAK